MAKNPVFYNSANEELKIETKGVTILDNEPKNSKGSKMIVQLFRKLFEPIKLNEGEDPYVKVGDKHVKLSDMMTEVEGMETKKAEADAAKAEAERKEHVLNDDDMVEYKGCKMSVGDLVKRHSELQEATADKEPEKKDDSKEEPKKEEEKKEQAIEKETPAEAKAEEKLQSADPVKTEEAEKEEVQAQFNELKNAADKADLLVNDVSTIKSAHEGMETGKSLYGSGR
jgi:flagellar biosynthesis GTPase FlhF